MDRGLYIAMTAGKNVMQAQAIRANNLANASTHGFQEDFEQARAMPVYYGDGHNSRVYAMTERPGVNLQRGAMSETGRDLDVAVKGDGWLAVQAPDGSEAYTRTASLHVNAQGLLTTGEGLPVMGEGGAITLPESAAIKIGADGSINLQGFGEKVNALAVVDKIKLVKLDEASLTKGKDGLIRSDTEKVDIDPSVNLEVGFLETSNVNTVDQLVSMINLSRQYEMNINMMKKLEENDQAVETVLRS